MKRIYQESFSKALSIDNHTEKLTFLTSILRSILQTAVICTFEITKNFTPHDESDLAELADRFQKPSDGLPLQILDNLVPFVRAHFDKQFLSGWFELIRGVQTPVSKALIEWVEFRNRRQAHGVLDKALSTLWSEKTEKLIESCMQVFSNILPSSNGNDLLQLTRIAGEPKVTTPLIYNGFALVILGVAPKQGIWKLKGQTLSNISSEEVTLLVPDDNAFSTTSIRPASQYALSEIVSNGKDYSFFNNIPVRQTDTFEGRGTELAQIKDWLDDKDSRYCLIYGDGGYGKTTLAIEFLNQLAEGLHNLDEPIPTIISYHTAKMTKWSEKGLEHFTSISPVMDECIRELMRCFYPILSQDWYVISGRQIIDKAVTVLKEQKFSRDDVLLIFDNTETLATSQQEVRELGAFFKQVGKLIGRLVITSRRREFLEATPIVIEGLTEAECVSLMQRLATEYKAKPILQAGESKLRRVAKQLMRKPLLLEALVKYISHSGQGIDLAVEHFLKKSSEELLDFLYEDAWVRMNSLQKDVLLVLIHASSPLDKAFISKACQEVGIQHVEFQLGLEETHFAVTTDYGKTYTIELVDLAKRFFLQQFSRLSPEEKARLKSIAENTDKYVLERAKIEKEYRQDRVAEAFRSEYAKAAKVATDKGDIPGALEMYELAIADDPLNSALHDRFSWVVLNKTSDATYARELSQTAVDLDENNCDAWVGLALANYRLGNLELGDDSIDRAGKKGRTRSFCLLRKAIARFHQTRDESEITQQIELLEAAEEFLIQAQKLNTNQGGYSIKYQRDIQRYYALTKAKLAVVRGKRTKLANSSIN